jgi:hypothetical protein
MSKFRLCRTLKVCDRGRQPGSLWNAGYAFLLEVAPEAMQVAVSDSLRVLFPLANTTSTSDNEN